MPSSHTYAESGLHGLLSALIVSALEAIERGSKPRTSKQNRQQAAEALCWFENTKDTHLFSFVSVCSILGLTPERGRELARLTARGHRWRSGVTGERQHRQYVPRPRQTVGMNPGERERYREVSGGGFKWTSGRPD